MVSLHLCIMVELEQAVPVTFQAGLRRTFDFRFVKVGMACSAWWKVYTIHHNYVILVFPSLAYHTGSKDQSCCNNFTGRTAIC